jgi:hypothetical protein
MLRKTLIVVGAALVVILIGGAVFVALRQNLSFEAPYPASQLPRSGGGSNADATCAPALRPQQRAAANVTGADVPLSAASVRHSARSVLHAISLGCRNRVGKI